MSKCISSAISVVFAVLLQPLSPAASLDDGWTADGVPVTLPHCWNIVDGCDGPADPKAKSGHDSVAGKDYERKCVTYRRTLPPTTAGLRRYMRVNAASIHAVVKADGREIARHSGAFTAFTFELPSDAREIEIAVDNFYDADVPPIAGDFTVYGGLYRGVELIEAGPERKFIAADGLFEDELAAPSGIPKYELREDGFYVDGKKLFLKGVCYHQDRDGKGWAISAEDEENDIRLIKAMGANAIRTSHYPRSERFYELCDKYGIYVWTEIPLVDKINDTEAFRANARKVAREMVLQHRHHKCIAMWGLFNELYLAKMPDGMAEPLVRELKKIIRSLDPRPIVAASCKLDRKELNAIPEGLGLNLYPGWYGQESAQLGEVIEKFRKENGRKIVCISEYGAGGSLGQKMPSPDYRPSPHGELHPVEYQLKHHQLSWAAIKADPHVWGCFLWVMFDAGSDVRAEGARRGINDKGLIAYDHKTLKPAYEFYKREWNSWNGREELAPFPRWSEPYAVTKGPKDHLLASYFAIDSWSPDKRYLLVLETEVNGRLPAAGERCTLGLVDLEKGNKFIPVTTTACWNFQEAAMAHWMNDDEILFNDVRDGKFKTVIMNWKTKAERVLPMPVSAVSEDRTWAVSINYARLSLTRPDYGYAGDGQDARADEMYPADDGVWTMNLKTGETKLIVPIAVTRPLESKVVWLKPAAQHQLAYHCHTVISKDGEKIFFLARTVDLAGDNLKKVTYWETTSFTVNRDGTDLRRCFKDGWQGSHFNWAPDGSHKMLVTAVWDGDKKGRPWHQTNWSQVEFEVGREDEVRQIGRGILDLDWHCIYSPDGKFMSGETYWNKNCERPWVLVRLADGMTMPMGSFFVPEAYRGNYWRCDLHARYRPDGRQIGFNSVHEGTRQVYLRDIMDN